MLFLLLLLQIICQIGYWDIVIEWIFSKNISTVIFNVLIKNNEQFDQNLHHITFLNTFLKI